MTITMATKGVISNQPIQQFEINCFEANIVLEEQEVAITVDELQIAVNIEDLEV